MNPQTRIELLTRWFPEMTTSVCRRLVKLIDNYDDLLAFGTFEDHTGALCLASWCAEYHPFIESGPEFLRFIGLPEISYVVGEWDTDCGFLEELAEMLRLELKYRKEKQRDHDSVRRVPRRPVVGLRPRRLIPHSARDPRLASLEG